MNNNKFTSVVKPLNTSKYPPVRNFKKMDKILFANRHAVYNLFSPLVILQKKILNSVILFKNY